MMSTMSMPQGHETAAYGSAQARWTALSERDPGADGQFYYAVRSTGIYCRPSCAARTPRRANVAFYDTRAEAELAGFRPCRRCRPEQPPLAERHAATVARICRLIENAPSPPPLAELARAAGMSRYYFHRVFKAVTGLTPRAYASARRTARMQAGLASGQAVTESLYAAGFNSSSRFYATADAALGMAPARFRAGGEGATIRFALGECALGAILVAATTKGVCAILLGDEPEDLLHELEDRFPRAELIGGDRDFEALVARVVGFVEAPASGINLPLDVRGTAFQQRVWQALRDIPPGATASYAQVAERIGQPRAARAVAGACAANALAVAIPCHRVVRRDGKPSGYRWGIERQRALLAREAAS